MDWFLCSVYESYALDYYVHMFLALLIVALLIYLFIKAVMKRRLIPHWVSGGYRPAWQCFWFKFY